MNGIALLVILFSLLPFEVMRITKKYFYFSLFAIIAVIINGLYLFGLRILIYFLIIYIISTLAELISLKSRFNVFGVKYRYNLDHSFFSSKINLLGVYPIEVSFTWVLLKYISFNITLLISQMFSFSLINFSILSALILVSLDLIVDPVAVKVAKMWKWEKGSQYFGIPYRNFLGWFLVGALSSYLFGRISGNIRIRFDYLFILPLVFYAIIIRNVRLIYKIDKTKAILGALPALFWIIAGTYGLLTLR